jgi:predicted amidohydrolase YtcJ
LNVLQAFDLYTRNAARVLGQQNVRGEIAVGHRADLVVLSADPMAVGPGELRQIEIDLTIRAGEIVHRR